MIVVERQNEIQVFNEIIEYNFKPVTEKPASVITVEVGIQLVSLWALATMAVNIWRFCTGC
jgi:hypothetical protein